MAKPPGYLVAVDQTVDEEKHILTITYQLRRRHPRYMLLMARELWQRVEITDKRTGQKLSKLRPWFLRMYVRVWWRAIFGPVTANERE